ncbi:hypothetical protein I7X12_17645 [Halosimplex litoreum]|uniref:Uncharacterized protein n=1 Tax=Halosimplex litoreum TaxID=1198301 RepID=A0A7T3KV21_9EURY|nr:hypothetical protein I7X12_17645 [Halosimplex litoreum]
MRGAAVLVLVRHTGAGRRVREFHGFAVDAEFVERLLQVLGFGGLGVVGDADPQDGREFDRGAVPVAGDRRVDDTAVELVVAVAELLQRGLDLAESFRVDAEGEVADRPDLVAQRRSRRLPVVGQHGGDDAGVTGVEGEMRRVGVVEG